MFCVNDLLKEEALKSVKVLGGREGLKNEIKGVTIIEAPDIAKFISGGEILLTGLYAFKSSTAEEFKEYINEFTRKEISALVIKKGRDVEFADGKISLLAELAEEYKIPLLEIPFEVPFRSVMVPIMEHLFNEEVTRLKYFKTTHDSFSSLSFALGSEENGYGKIIDTLETFIGNPIAIFNQNLSCLVSTDPELQELTITECAEEYDPKLYSNYHFLKQKTRVENKEKKEYNQYLVPLSIMFHMKMYLVVTETDRTVDIMDFIAIENAATALRLEFSRQYSISELEKRYRSDIMTDILGGKISSMKKLRQSTNLLGLHIDGNYRVLVFGLYDDEAENTVDFSSMVEYTNILYDSIKMNFPNVTIQDDLNSIVVIQEVDMKQKADAYRKETKKIVEKIQQHVNKNNSQLKVKAGIGKTAEGIVNIPDSFKEARDALILIDIMGEESEDGMSRLMFSSELGIFKLLGQLDDPDMLMEFVPESLQKLYNFKKSQKEDLIITLKTYLDRNQNLTKTAQDLFIHYKTAVYRIERITKITGIDFNNANEVLSVKIGIIIYKMIDNYRLDSV